MQNFLQIFNFQNSITWLPWLGHSFVLDTSTTNFKQNQIITQASNPKYHPTPKKTKITFFFWKTRICIRSLT